ncbi:MAG: hypothetical protein ABI874_02360 [Chloroflexota bacterium]
MRLSDYPRPPADTGIGFHYFPDFMHYASADLARWLPILQSVGASWLTLLAPLDGTLPERFVRGLLGSGIEPIIRLYTPTVAPLDRAQLNRLGRAYASWGVHYLHVFNEPNLAIAWTDFCTDGLPERFMDNLLPCLEVLMNIDGLVPLFPPLAQGGHVWDTEFLAACLDLFNARGYSSLFDRIGVAMHNYAGNRPLMWGHGGPSRWPDAQPYSTPPGVEDQLGFRLFEWYDAIIRARVGRSLPLIACESGARFGARDVSELPAIDRMLHAQRHAEMSFAVMNNQVPACVFNNAFWLLSANPDSPFANDGWFNADGSPRLGVTVAIFRQVQRSARTLNASQ